MRWARHVAHLEGEEESIQGFGANTTSKRPLRRPRRRWENNVKMDLRYTEWFHMDWTNLAQDRDQWRALMNTVMNFRFP
jgi:hypothetical protein